MVAQHPWDSWGGRLLCLVWVLALREGGCWLLATLSSEEGNGHIKFRRVKEQKHTLQS